jgi:hypothetical protein
MTQKAPTHETLSITDPATGRVWEVPRRLTRTVVADVAERWVANVDLSQDACRRIVTPPFLEPIPVNGRHILSLCAIFMRHTAPAWAPLHMGPASHNCALRVACTDRRDGSPAVWVDHRYTDSPLAGALSKLGFAPVRPHLIVSRHPRGGKQRLGLQTLDGEINLDLIETSEPQPADPLFKNSEQFADYFLAGSRSYGPTDRPGQYTVVDLDKQRVGPFEAITSMHGSFKTRWGGYTCQSVYLSRNSLYRWRYVGLTNSEGRMIPGDE